MKLSQLTYRGGAIALSLACVLSTALPASADSVVLKKGTDVKMEFDSNLSSSTAKPGDKVSFHVSEPVKVDDKVVIPEGTKVTGTVEKVHKRGRFGTNANIQLLLNPVKSASGKMIPLGFKSKSGDLSRPGTAAGASIGTAAVLGPIGLAAGYFVVGKKVNAKPGDKLTADVDKDVTVKAQ